MASGPLVYKVDDRSILLPYYRRWLVDPLLPLIPRRVNPNSITHLGHLMNLVGTVALIYMWPERGWPFISAAVLLQAYMWCDNADGAHARRTNQCSAFGEFLDHGLDQLNTVYIAYLTCMALNVSPLWWAVIALIIPGAGAVTYFEQSRTGIFRLGLLNQVESLTVLSITLIVSGIFGRDIWKDTHLVGPITLQLAILAWSSSTIIFGMLRGVGRVIIACGARSALPVMCLLAFGAAIVLLVSLDVLDAVTAVSLCTGANVYFGMRMLAHRLHGEAPRIEAALVAGTVALLALAAWSRAGYPVSPYVRFGLAAIVCGVFGVSALLDARRSIVHLETISTAR